MSARTRNTHRIKVQKSELWRVPLKHKVGNENMDTMLLNCPYPRKSINNVYEIPSTEQAINYPHACAGFPTKTTRLRSISLGNYTTWTGFTIKATNKYLPEYE